MPVGRSKLKVGRGFIGSIPDTTWFVVERAWSQGIAASSNMAREMSSDIALAASMGWISTISPDGISYGRIWHVTAEGLHAYQATSSN